MGEELLANPMSWGEIGTVSAMTAFGWIVTDMLDRYIGSEPSSFTPNAGDVQVPNAASVLGMPSWGRILTQAGIGVVGFGFGGYMSRGGRGGVGAAALNGIGLGAAVHLIGQLFNAMMARAAGSSSSALGTNPNGFLARLYSGEIAAQNAQFTTQAQAAGGTPAGNAVPGFAAVPGLSGPPGSLGAALGQVAVYNPMTYNGVPMWAPPVFAYNPQVANGVPVAPGGAGANAFVPAVAANPGVMTPAPAIPTNAPTPVAVQSSTGSCFTDGAGLAGLNPFESFPD
jgi:hypothetical protein